MQPTQQQYGSTNQQITPTSHPDTGLDAGPLAALALMLVVLGLAVRQIGKAFPYPSRRK
jgi:hypothetical protein